jgi:hypothetical protein
MTNPYADHIEPTPLFDNASTQRIMDGFETFLYVTMLIREIEEAG